MYGTDETVCHTVPVMFSTVQTTTIRQFRPRRGEEQIQISRMCGRKVPIRHPGRRSGRAPGGQVALAWPGDDGSTIPVCWRRRLMIDGDDDGDDDDDDDRQPKGGTRLPAIIESEETGDVS